MVKNSNFIKETEEYIKKINAEAVYFTANEEERTAIFIADIPLQIRFPKLLNHCFLWVEKYFAII